MLVRKIISARSEIHDRCLVVHWVEGWRYVGETLSLDSAGRRWRGKMGMGLVGAVADVDNVELDFETSTLAPRGMVPAVNRFSKAHLSITYVQ